MQSAIVFAYLFLLKIKNNEKFNRNLLCKSLYVILSEEKRKRFS